MFLKGIKISYRIYLQAHKFLALKKYEALGREQSPDDFVTLNKILVIFF